MVSELAVATGLDEARIQELFLVSIAPLSLDQTYGASSDDEQTVLGSLFADRNAVPVEESAVQSVQRSEVSALLREHLSHANTWWLQHTMVSMGNLNGRWRKLAGCSM